MVREPSRACVGRLFAHTKTYPHDTQYHSCGGCSSGDNMLCLHGATKAYTLTDDHWSAEQVPDPMHWPTQGDTDGRSRFCGQ